MAERARRRHPHPDASRATWRRSPTRSTPIPPSSSPRNSATPCGASPSPTSKKACSTRPTIRRTLQPRAAGRHHHGPRRPRQDLAARRHPLDRSGGRRSRRHHPAHRRLSGDVAVGRQASPSSIRPATPPSPRCAPAAPRSPTSSCWWSPPTTASCRRRSRRSITPRRRRFRSSSRSTRSTSRTPSPSACAPSCCSTRFRSNCSAATCSKSRSRRQEKTNLDKLLEMIGAAGRNARPQGQSEPRRPKAP